MRSKNFSSSFCIVLFLCRMLWGQPVIFEKPLSPRIASYVIDVRLEPEKRMLHGTETLTWHNQTKSNITDLHFHLYLNAFRNEQSTFMKESRGVSRGSKIDKDGYGFIEVQKISTASGIELTDNMEFIQPDDDNEHDKTVFRLPLPQPLLPGEKIELHLDFIAKLPTPPFARTGAYKEYFFMGQWFPKIGVHQDGKWNCHQFHATSEFFADFGVYDVRMTVPEKNIVGATGIEVEVVQNGDGTATHYYHAEDVHDFAWTTSPEFVVFTDKAQDVDIRLLLQPDHVSQAQRHLAATKVAIEHFQNSYGDYPFTNLTVVDPRRGAGGSGGMEYPTLITAGTSYGRSDGVRLVECVIIHEFGHNYWYHLIASNEFEESWLDEGINSYCENLVMSKNYGPHGDQIDFMGLKINTQQFQRLMLVSTPNYDPIVQNTWDFYSERSWANNSFFRSALLLLTLEKHIGKERMQQVLRTYADRWRFKHPKTQDFIQVVNEISEQDWTWFFDQALYTNAALDYSVASVLTRKLDDEKGFDFSLDVEKELRGGEQDKDSISAQEIEHDTTNEKADTKMYYSRVKVRRLGEFIFPVEIEIVFDNNEKIREHWDGKDYWKKLEYIKPAKLISATVDPDGLIPLDINFTNNSRTVKTQSLGVNKLTIRGLFWAQFMLDQPEFLNALSGLVTFF